MTSWKQLSRPLRVAIAAPWLLLTSLVGVASVPSFRALVVDPTGQPTIDVSLSSAHWTGTLAAARLPGNVPLLDGAQGLTIPGPLTVDSAAAFHSIRSDENAIASDANGGLTVRSLTVNGDAGSNVVADTYGNLYATHNIFAGGCQIADGAGNLYSGSYEVADPYGNLYAFQALYVNGNLLADDAGNLYVYNNAYLGGGLSLWGTGNPPSSQPATPTDLAGAIAVLQAYGLCQ